MGLCLVLFYRSNGETPSFPASVCNRFPPAIEPYIRSFNSLVDFDTTVLIPRSLSQCILLGFCDAGGCLRLLETAATRLALRGRSASACDPCRQGDRVALLSGLSQAKSCDACSGSGRRRRD